MGNRSWLISDFQVQCYKLNLFWLVNWKSSLKMPKIIANLTIVAGVPIMHLISIPFPRVWHTVDDNLNALDSRRIELITRIITDFVAQYLHLRVPPK